MGKMKLTILTVILAAVAISAVGCGGNGGGYSEAEAVKVEATRQAVSLEATRTALDLERAALDLERDTRRQAAMDPFVLALPWMGLVVLVVCLGAVGLVGWRWLQVWEARARLVHRAPEAGETILTLGRGERYALPLRSGNVYADLTKGAERSPMLAASADAQERATMRQQAGNLALSSNAHETVKARLGSGDVYLLPGKREQARALPARAHVEPGLLGAISPDAVPPKLLDAIVTGWEEVEEEV